MPVLTRGAALRRELSAAERIPYRAHVAAGVIRTEYGDYLQAFRLGGASFESRDDAELNNWHARLNVLWRNIASPGIALWSHVIRRAVRLEEEDGAAPGRGGASFAVDLHGRYRHRLSGEALMLNELYLAVLYRPVSGAATGALSRLITRARNDAQQAELADALDACEKLAQTLLASLARYEPEALGCYRHQGFWCSSLLEFLGLLINGEKQRMPLPRAPLHEALASTRLFFGIEAIEYRAPAETRVGAMLGIKEYPTPTYVGMYDRLLSAPLSFVLTQSFAFLSKASGQSLLQRQFNRMANAGDFAVSQAEELKQALDALTSNEFVMGDHHFSLQLTLDLPGPGSSASELGAGRLKALNDQVARARSLLADTGMLVAREDLALEAAFWAQLPGNFPYRPRKAPITSRNFAAMTPFHNYPLGRAHGNHWGPALTLLVTSARSPYHFSLHASDPGDPEGGSRRDTGHTLICGPTGSGKTVFIGFLIGMLARRETTQVIFDKDRGLEILVRALGGEYFPLKNGTPTGFNPLQLPATPSNIEFLKVWLRELSARDRCAGMPVREQSDLEQALRGTLALDVPARRLSRLVEFLDPTDPEGLHARLSRWCESCRGDYAWAFDNPVDTLAGRLAGRTVIGFDVTEFLDHAQTRSAVTLYLFHVVRQLLDGRRLVCWMDEFWRLLADPAFESFAKDGPKTWRKLNAVMCLATQSPSDVLQSSISRTLVEQTPTKVFFPNADASHQEYTQGFGLTDREFRLVKEHLEPGSRTFLVKQSHHSVVCELDLKGFDAELAVISGRAAQVARMNELISGTGPAPENWLPAFMAENAAGGRQRHFNQER
ncbi:MAG TPA: VirB4 family type IV secretion/conjugal transfer ATPase [Steroidobacteraceae bacterium]|nr:VirB4 family type IV secretion/conjugal transfer ATPase [Steroidobacteraceae bacterium]